MTDCTSRLWLADGTRAACDDHPFEFDDQHIAYEDEHSVAWTDSTPGAHDASTPLADMIGVGTHVRRAPQHGPHR